MSKNVQIPEDLFWDLCRYHLLDLEADEAEYTAQTIQDGLRAKLEAVRRRVAYTAYKDRSLSPAARETARQQYLDLVGMLPGYRWDSLEPPL